MPSRQSAHRQSAQLHSGPPRFGDRRRTRIGLLGGSFNPAHEGHRFLAERAMRALGLDQVWLLVSPGNPLKDGKPMASVAERLASAARLADGRRIVATDIERHLHTRYTCDTLAALRRRFPAARFVWLMGADGLRDLPHWRGWQRIARLVPFAVFPRPSYNHAALSGRAAHRLGPWRRRTREASSLASAMPPAWTYLIGRESSISATALRAAGQQEPSTTGQGDGHRQETRRRKRQDAAPRGSSAAIEPRGGREGGPHPAQEGRGRRPKADADGAPARGTHPA